MKKRSPDIHLSIIIPAFNEARRIESSLDKIVVYLDKQSYKSEVLVVVDGSQDQTLTRVSRAALWRQYINVLDNRVNRGKGFAVRRGMLSARGDYLLFTEADLPTPIDQVERLMKELEGGSDVAIGSRALPESEVTAHYGWWHRPMRGVFTSVARLMLLRGIPRSDVRLQAVSACGGAQYFSAAVGQGFRLRCRSLADCAPERISRRGGGRLVGASS